MISAEPVEQKKRPFATAGLETRRQHTFSRSRNLSKLGTDFYCARIGLTLKNRLIAGFRSAQLRYSIRQADVFFGSFNKTLVV